jgi:L-threonylcarbamoyladenylate synthase
MRRVFVDPGAPQRDAIEEAVKWVLAGGVVAMGTDTLYGLAVDPFNRAAVSRLFELKERESDRAMPLIASDAQQVAAHLGRLSPAGERLAARYWPGPLTVTLPAPATLPREVTAGLRTVAVRVPAADIARAICAGCRTPVTATSANLSGRAPTADPDVVERELGHLIDFLLDTGPAPGGPPSTIVDATRTPPTLIRAGAIAWNEIEAWLDTDHREPRA